MRRKAVAGGCCGTPLSSCCCWTPERQAKLEGLRVESVIKVIQADQVADPGESLEMRGASDLVPFRLAEGQQR